ncbi:MAG: aldo/keto reductase [Chloroflexota bacterium]|nr:aldo/keto reductase [Chloroflexota bacterium]
MFKRKLGHSEIEVSAMGMGCWAIGGPWTFEEHPAGWGQIDDAESIRGIQLALDSGINFFDTAANYGAGHSEHILGRAIADRRDKAVIATKFGYRVDEVAKNVSHYGNPKSDDIIPHIRQDCENSLRCLDTDYIDLYQFHVGYYNPAKAGEVCDALEDLVTEGKIRYYGWSTDNPKGARVFSKGEHCASIQHLLHVLKDAPEMLAVCGEHNLSSIVRGPLGRGFLTGKYNQKSKFSQDDHRGNQRFQDQWARPVLEGLGAVREILTSEGRTLAQGALGWVWARSERTIPIPGFKTVAQVEENASAIEFGSLNDEQMQEIDRILERKS